MNDETCGWVGDWRVGVRVWVERQGEAILGEGRLELLEWIDRCHSISAAARGTLTPSFTIRTAADAAPSANANATA